MLLPYLTFLAIRLIQPNMSAPAVQAYADIINQESDKIDVSPLVIIGIIKHESDFNVKTISPDGEDYGLMQIRARYYKGDVNQLLNPKLNIQNGSYIIKEDINMCRKYLHREPQYQEWLACYTGSCIDSAHMCRPTRLTQVFEDYLMCLTTDVLTGQSKTQCQKIYDKQFSEQARNKGIPLR